MNCYGYAIQNCCVCGHSLDSQSIAKTRPDSGMNDAGQLKVYRKEIRDVAPLASSSCTCCVCQIWSDIIVHLNGCIETRLPKASYYETKWSDISNVIR